MTLPGRYNVGGFGSYFTSSYNSINYNKSSSFSQDLKNRGYFLTLTTLNRSPRYHTLISTENSSDAEKDSNPTENSTTTSESVSKHESNSEQSKQTSFSDLNDENEEREASPPKTRSALRRDSKDQIKIFNRDEWLLKRQRERTMKLLDLNTDSKKAKEKTGCDEICNNNQTKVNFSDGISPFSSSQNSSRDNKSSTSNIDNFNCDTLKHGVKSKSEQESRSESIETTKTTTTIEKNEKRTAEPNSYSLRSSYGSRARDSFDGILKHLKTTSKSEKDPSTFASQNDLTKVPKEVNRKSDEKSTCVMNLNSNVKNCVDIVKYDKDVRSEKMSDCKEDTLNIRKIRKKLLPRSATSAADTTYSVSQSKSKRSEDENFSKCLTDSNQILMNGTKHASMKLRRKSEISNNINANNWMVRPTDPSEEASETDIILLKRWIEQSQLWNMEENPLKIFRIKEGEELDDIDIEGKVLRCVGGKFCVAPPVLISTPLDPYRNLFDDIKQYDGDRNEEGIPHGKNVVITFKTGDVFRGSIENGERHGYGILQFAGKKRLPNSPSDISYVEGTYRNNQLNGYGKITHLNGDVLYCVFAKGLVTGPSKLYDKKCVLKEMGWYYRNVHYGFIWKFLRGGGYLIGQVDSLGAMSGENISFLYPDLRTAMYGSFIKGKMSVAQTSFVKSVTIRRQDNMAVLNFTVPKGPFFAYDPSTFDHVSNEPLLQDPYETQNVTVRMSKVRGAGEGLFANRSFEKGTFISFYNGIRMLADDLDEDSKEEWEENAYKIMDLLGPDENGREGVIDIPEEYISFKNYKASCAHKCNHSFTPNAKFSVFDHPRFGAVPAVEAIMDIKEGDEVTVSYDYDMDDAPPWYQDLYTQRIFKSYQQSKQYFCS